ncbi:unnamed protein product [Ascophyllum nodosum]
MKCACRQLLQCYTKPAMQVCFVPKLPSYVSVWWRTRREYGLRALALVSRRRVDLVVCARFLAVVGVDVSVANTSHVVVALRVRQTAHSMKIGSADTAFVVRKQRRVRRVVRLCYAERTRCARRVSLLISILKLNLVLTYGIPPEFRGGAHLFIYNCHTPSGQSRVYRVTQLRTNGVHCPESAGTGPVNLKVVPNECCLGRSPWTN